MSTISISRLAVLFIALCGLLIAAGVLLLLGSGALSANYHPHAAVVLLASAAFLVTAIALSVVNRRLGLAAFLVVFVLLIDLLFFLEVRHEISIAAYSECPFGICWAAASQSQREIFGFAEFVTALALLVIVYTVTDVRYRFRVQVAPVPLYKLTYTLLATIGFGTLLIDLWFAKAWPVPGFLSDQSLWQAGFGFVFLSIAMAWLWFAFIRPPVFGKNNALRFTQTLYRYILRGWDSELPVVADELIRSAEPIVKLSNVHPRARHPMETQKFQQPSAADYAHDLLLLIGNRKFCRCVAASSPVTAIAFFEKATESRKLHIPLGTFASNVVTEALLNKDSILYHEDAGYFSGLIGYVQPFSRAVFGDFRLVESLAGDDHSPLDVNFELRFSWDADQLSAYCRCVLVMLDGYFEARDWYQHSYALYRALDTVHSGCRDISKLNDQTVSYSDELRRLHRVVNFANDAVERAGKHADLPITLRKREDSSPWQYDFLDHVAELMFKVIFYASAVRAPTNTNWEVQHNAVWADFIRGRDTRAKRCVRFKLHRLLYNEIRRLESLPNYKSARILGFCLNVMGLSVGDKSGFRSEEYPLRKAVLNWTRKNYLKLVDVQPDVAQAVLTGAVTFDAENKRLLKTYAKGLALEAPKTYLDLENPQPA